MNVTTVQGNTLAKQVHAALTERILSGELPVGSRLKDNELAASFGTSNTPVREALRELERDGLVELHPYRGCVVRHVSVAELSEIYEVRIALEKLAARLAAASISEEELATMEQLIDVADPGEAAGDQLSAIEVGSAFHEIMYRSTRNGTLQRVLRDLDNRIRITRHMDPLKGPLPHRLDHRRLVEALRRRDGEGAAAIVAEHIRSGKERVLELLRE